MIEHKRQAIYIMDFIGEETNSLKNARKKLRAD